MFAFFEPNTRERSSDSDEEVERKRGHHNDDRPPKKWKDEPEVIETNVDGVDKETAIMMKQLEAEEDMGQFRGLKGTYASAACAYHMRDTIGRVHCRSALLCGKKHPVHVGDEDGAIVATNYLSVIADEHGSWLNIAEIELSALTRQCLDRRLDNLTLLCQEKKWETSLNHNQKPVDWQFTSENARTKLKRLYPQF
jgi:hypothetical protein